MKMEISNNVTLENGQSNPFGWSQYEIHYKGERIGRLESGYPANFEKGYSFEVVDDVLDGRKVSRCLIYKEEDDGVIEASELTEEDPRDEDQ